MSPRREPRRLGEAVSAVRRATAPQTPLAAVQSAWEEAVGARIAAVAEPVSERGGRVTVACESAVWAQELDLMQAEILARLATAMDSPPVALRFKAGR